MFRAVYFDGFSILLFSSDFEFVFMKAVFSNKPQILVNVPVWFGYELCLHKILRITENAIRIAKFHKRISMFWRLNEQFELPDFLFLGLNQLPHLFRKELPFNDSRFEMTGRETDDPNNSMLSKKAERDSSVSLFNDAKDVQTKSFWSWATAASFIKHWCLISRV